MDDNLYKHDNLHEHDNLHDNLRYLALVVLVIMLIAGVVSGEFVEIWRNGSTL